MPSFEKETRPLPYPEQRTAISPWAEATGLPGPRSVIATFLSPSSVVTLRAVEGQVALLVAQLTPVQFAWISQLVAQGCVVAVGLSLVESPYVEKGHR